jgi:hypothetical protein
MKKQEQFKEARTRIKKDESRNTNKERRQRTKEQGTRLSNSANSFGYGSRKNTPEGKKTVN